MKSLSNFHDKEKKNCQIGPETTKLRKLDLCGPKVIWGKVQYWILNPHRISKSKKKNYSNRSINNEIVNLWSVSDLRESTISDLESPSNFQVKEKKILKSVQKQRNYAHIKNAKNIFTFLPF